MDNSAVEETKVGVPQPVIIMYAFVGERASRYEARSVLKKMADTAGECFRRAGWDHVLYVPVYKKDTHIEAILVKNLDEEEFKALEEKVLAAIGELETEG